uniref:Spermatogenesis-related protein n=1 Tax=Rattus norvegicus TaxID=10116 RepID=Q8K598_RAT|nr:spermatogenesis-related protein [Rattus norvegicus]
MPEVSRTHFFGFFLYTQPHTVQTAPSSHKDSWGMLSLSFIRIVNLREPRSLKTNSGQERAKQPVPWWLSSLENQTCILTPTVLSMFACHHTKQNTTRSYMTRTKCIERCQDHCLLFLFLSLFFPELSGAGVFCVSSFTGDTGSFKMISSSSLISINCDFRLSKTLVYKLAWDPG